MTKRKIIFMIILTVILTFIFTIILTIILTIIFTIILTKGVPYHWTNHKLLASSFKSKNFHCFFFWSETFFAKKFCKFLLFLIDRNCFAEWKVCSCNSIFLLIDNLYGQQLSILNFSLLMLWLLKDTWNIIIYGSA